MGLVFFLKGDPLAELLVGVGCKIMVSNSFGGIPDQNFFAGAAYRTACSC